MERGSCRIDVSIALKKKKRGEACLAATNKIQLDLNASAVASGPLLKGELSAVPRERSLCSLLPLATVVKDKLLRGKLFFPPETLFI